MSNTPKLKLVELTSTASQAQVVNTGGYSILDVLVDKTVKSRGTNTPPSTPNDGDAYILGSSPTGLWSGKATQIAYWRTSAGVWQFIVPLTGWTLRVQDDLDANGIPKQYGYTGSAWAAPADGGSFTGGTLASALNEAPPVTLASAATVNIGAAAANTINVTGTTTITAFDTIAAGATRRVIFVGILTLTHNATSLILPTGANITTAAGDAAEFVSLGSGNWKCIAYQRANGTALATGGSSLSNFTEALNTTSPNATVPVVSLTATNAATNVDIAYVPKGTGAILAQVPDGTATAGNKRGASAFDFQVSRSAAAQVASGANSVIVGGQQNTASGQRSFVGGGISNAASGGNDVIAGGNGNTSTGGQNFIGAGSSNSAAGQHNTVPGGSSNTIPGGSFCFIGGGQSNVHTGTGDYRSHLGGTGNSSPTGITGCSTTGGRDNVANADYSIVLGGYRAQGRQIYGAVHHANGFFAANGDAQWSNYLFRARTTAATAADMTADGAAVSISNAMVLNGGQQCWFGKVMLVARNTGNGEMAAWEASVLLRRTNTAATIAIVGTPTFSLIAADSSLSGLTAPNIYVNTTVGGGVISVTGLAATTIDWVARVNTVEAG